MSLSLLNGAESTALVCPRSQVLALAGLPIKDGCRGIEMQVHLTASISSAEVQRDKCLAEPPICLDVLSFWIMFLLKLTETEPKAFTITEVFI